MAAMHVDQQVADQRLRQVLPARDIFERHTLMLMLARTKVGETVSVREPKEVVVDKVMEPWSDTYPKGDLACARAIPGFRPSLFHPPQSLKVHPDAARTTVLQTSSTLLRDVPYTNIKFYVPR